MRRVGLILVLLVAVATALTAGGVRAPAAQPVKEAVAVGTGGAVASVDPDATRAGIQILREGGNAVDAAVAANAVLGVTEPFVAGIGGGGFMVIYLAREHRVITNLAREHRVITIDGRETAPHTFPVDAFVDAAGQPIPFFPQRVTSGMAVGVPGTLATWASAASEFGTMPLKRLLQPAIAVAEKGFTVDATFRSQVASNLTRLDAFTSSRSLFLTPDRQPPEVGSTFRNPDLAHAYRLISQDGAEAFYDGPIGAALVDTVHNPPVADDSHLGFTVPPGLMTTGDLARYASPLRSPTHVTYRGYDVYGMGPPSSGGSTVGEALNILEGFDMSTPDRALALHRYLEASKLAFADRNQWVGDPGFVSVPLDGLLSKDFAAERRCLIGGTALPTPVAPGDPYPPFTPCTSVPAPATPARAETSTNHLTVIDRYGNVVAYTSTIEQIAGSAITVPGYGFLLNNELTDFNAVAASAGDPNLPAGDKRPRSSMAPTIVLHDGRPLLGVGTPGSSMIITTVLQILLDRLDFGMSLPDAIAAPRASQRNLNTTNVAEPSFISQYGADLQARFGQLFTPTPEIGAATGIEVLPDGELQAATEPTRRGGGAAAVVCPAADHPLPASPQAVCAPVPGG